MEYIRGIYLLAMGLAIAILLIKPESQSENNIVRYITKPSPPSITLECPDRNRIHIKTIQELNLERSA